MSMYLREGRIGNKVRVQIVESYRNAAGQPRQRIVQHIGTAEPGPQLEERVRQGEYRRAELQVAERPALFPSPMLADLAIAARQHPHPSRRRARWVDLNRVREESRLILGGHEVLGTVFDRAGLGRVFSARHRASARWFRDAVICRLLPPGQSKRAHAELMGRVRPGPAPVERWYRMMDGLTDARIDTLQSQIAAVNSSLLPDAPTEVLFFDATTLHFESEQADALREKGWSKNGKSNRVPVVLAVLMGPAGLPMGYRLYPGNTSDVRTLQPMLADARRRHGAVPMAWVSDAGMLSAENLAALAAANCDHIIAARLRTLRRSWLAQVCDIDGYGPPDAEGVRILDQRFGERRLVVRDDPRRARKDAANRQRALRKARAMLRSGQVSRHPYISVPRGEGGPRINEAALERDARFDGLHGVWTSFADMPAATIRQRYGELWTIEHGFRTLKTDLGIRPVFHWTKRRVLAHIAICFTAFALLRMLMYQLRRTKAWAEPLSEARVLETLRAVQASLIRDDATGDQHLLPSAPRPLQKAIYQLLGLQLPVYCHPLESTMYD